MLKLTGVYVGYGRKAVLGPIDTVLHPHEIVGLVAPNGYGKTTLMQALAGERPLLRSGVITIDDKKVTFRELRASVFYAPGDASILHPSMNARAHLTLVARAWASMLDVENVLDKCGISTFADKPVKSLSQGMKQQVVMAMALVSGARVILLDETLNALDPIHVDRAIGMMKWMRDRGSSVLISSHILDNIDRACSAVYFVQKRVLMREPIREASANRFKELYA